MIKPHILILGAGFGGMYTAREFKHLVKRGVVDVTIINETNYFLFTPLLHEVATGSLGPQSVSEPLREIFAGSGINICQGTVISIDRKNRKVIVLGDVNGDDIHHRVKHEISYDFLVVSTGATTNYYNIPGADIHTYPLKTLYDAVMIRRRIIDSFEEAVMCDDPLVRSQLLSFVVVGGGPTGVEIVSELSDFVKEMIKRYFNNFECTVTLINSGPELLQQFSPKLRKSAYDRLIKEGVEISVGSSVTSVSPRGIELSNNTTVFSSTIIWAAGVTPVIPPFEVEAPELLGKRLAIDEYFRLAGDERVFALGDTAGSSPMLAQAAVGQARVVASNIKASIEGKKLKIFKYHSKGSMVSIGQYFAIGEIFSLKISGVIAWWMWRTIYLFKFISWKKRLRIVASWTINLFYPRDITRL